MPFRLQIVIVIENGLCFIIWPGEAAQDRAG
jgi:hypothetical protein